MCECYTRSFLSKSACRSCGKEKELQKDSCVDERGLIAPGPSQSGGGMTSGAAARPAGTAKGPAQVLAQTRLQLTQAREQGGRGRDEKSSAHRPEDGPGVSQISSSCGRGREGAGSNAQSQANFEQAQQEVRTGPTGLAQAHCRKPHCR